MATTIRRSVTVQPGGRIELSSPELTPAARAEVTVLVEDGKARTPRRRPLASYVGVCKGSFATADEVDEFLRRERDAWG